jgi:hypothetical protein
LAKVAAMAAAVDTVPAVLAVVAEPVDIRAPAEMAELAVTLDKTVLVEPAAAAAAAITSAAVTQLPVAVAESAFMAKDLAAQAAQAAMAPPLILEVQARAVAMEIVALVGMQGCMAAVAQVYDQEAHLP